MSKKVFVGGLAWATTDESLRAAFERCGPVTESKVVTDRDTGRSKGFGFVTFADEASCAKAIETMNGAQLDGRTIASTRPRTRVARAAVAAAAGTAAAAAAGMTTTMRARKNAKS